MPVDTEVAEVGEVGDQPEADAEEVGPDTGENPDTAENPVAGENPDTAENLDTGENLDAADAPDTPESPDTAADPDNPDAEAAGHGAGRWRAPGSRVIVQGVLPGLVLILALVAGFLKWQDSASQSGTARIESMAAATESTIALLSYQPETVEQELGAARDRLTGEFRDSYARLTDDVVIPGAKEQQITALASVPATASVSVSPSRAVVLVFVNQTITVGDDAPTDTASSVRVTLDKVDGRWLISGFDPV